MAGKTELYAPVPKNKVPKAKDSGKDGPKVELASAVAGQAGTDDTPKQMVVPAPVSEFEPKPGDSQAVAHWRRRMDSDEAREIYRHRAATAECVNAQARNRGLLRMPVRGLPKVKCFVRLFVLAHNLLRMAAVAAKPA